MAGQESRSDCSVGDEGGESLRFHKPEALPTVAEHDVEETDDQPMLVIPPDGGYGWVIVAASFLANMMVDGIAYAFGILLIELVSYFEEGKAKVSLVGSLLCGVYLGTGPIAAAFVQLYGCRKVTIVGSFLSCLGLVLSTFANNVETLIFTYGVLGGFGFGLVYLPSTIIVNLYFESRRSLAVGIAVCGSGVGAVVFAPLMSFLMDVYDWKNTMLILAGLMLNCAVFGALYRPLTPPKPSKAGDTGPSSEAVETGSIGSWGSSKRRRGKSGGSVGGEPDVEDRKQLMKNPVDRADILNYIKRNHEESENDGNLHASDNITALPTSNRHRTRSDCPPEQRVDTSFQLIRSTPNLGDVKRALLRSRHSPAEMLVPLPPRVQKPEEYAKPMNRKDIFYAGSVFNMSRAGIASTANIAASNQLIGSWIMSMTRIPAEDEADGGGERSCWQRVPMSLRNVIEQMTDFSLLKTPAYLFTWIANVFFMIGYYVPFFLLMDFAVIHNGIPQQQAAFIVSAIGIANTLGRIFFGWLVGLPCVTALFVNNATIFAAGLITMLVPFCTSFPLMLAYGIGYGLLVAPIISLTSELLCDMFGIDKLTNAFGLLTLARGISSSVGPPFAGFLFDQTNRFDIPYYSSGGIIVLSSLVFCLLYLPPFRKEMQKTKRNFEEQVAAFVAASSSALNHMDSLSVV